MNWLTGCKWKQKPRHCQLARIVQHQLHAKTLQAVHFPHPTGPTASPTLAHDVGAPEQPTWQPRLMTELSFTMRRTARRYFRTPRLSEAFREQLLPDVAVVHAKIRTRKPGEGSAPDRAVLDSFLQSSHMLDVEQCNVIAKRLDPGGYDSVVVGSWPVPDPW